MRVRALPRDQYPEKLLFVYDKTNVFRKYECPPVFTDDGAKDQTFVANPWGNGMASIHQHPTRGRTTLRPSCHSYHITYGMV